MVVPEPLRERLGPDAVQALVDLLNQSSRETRDEVLTFAEQRFERRLAEEIGKLRDEMRAGFASIEARFGGLEGHSGSLEARVSDTFAAQTRWMVGLWITQLGIILGTLFAFFRP